MSYEFNAKTFEALQKAFAGAELIRENNVKNCYRSWDYLFLKFQAPIELEAGEVQQQDLIDLIFAGDAELKSRYKGELGADPTIEAGFRWAGTPEGDRKIRASGFAIKISYPKASEDPRREVFVDATLALLRENNLLAQGDGAALKEKFNQLPLPTTLPAVYQEQRVPTLFKKSSLPVATAENAKKYLAAAIKPIAPKYRRDNENGINPAYQDLKNKLVPLQPNQKVIWLLRSDGILATGTKNSYWISFGENELISAIPDALHQYLNWDDRYGHPSLALTDEHYDGSALYGGYVCQRKGHLQVFTSSGRYYRDDLEEDQKRILEAYLAHCFQDNFGEQDVIFYEGPYKDYYELSIFYANQALPSYVKNRTYTTTSIAGILEGISFPKSQRPSLTDLCVSTASPGGGGFGCSF